MNFASFRIIHAVLGTNHQTHYKTKTKQRLHLKQWLRCMLGTAFNTGSFSRNLHLIRLFMFHLFAVVATPSLVSAAALGGGRDSTVTRPARPGTTEKRACCRAAAATELTVTRSQGPVCAPLGSWWVHRSCQRLWSVYFIALYFDFHLTFTLWHGLVKTIAHLFPLMEVKERKKQKIYIYTENN